MKEKEIVIWHEMDGAGDSSLKFIETICRELHEKENLSFRFVQMNLVPFTERLRHLDEQKEKPDVIFIAQDLVNMEGAHLSEVPERFGRYMAPKTWDSMKYKGVQRGVPYLQGNHAVIFYNKKYFDKRPESWDDIRAMRRRGVCPFSLDLTVQYWLLPFVYTIYGNPIKGGRVTITSENTGQVQRFLGDLLKEGTLRSYSAISTMLDKFIAGEIACMLNGEWLYEYLHQEMGEDVGISRLPRMGQKEMTGVSSSVGIAFPANSLEGEKKTELGVFLDYMLSEDVQTRWLTEHKRIPVNQKVLAHMDQLAVDENIKISCGQMEKNYFLINELCLSDLWQQGEKILKKVVENNAE